MLKTFIKQFSKNKITGLKIKTNIKAPNLNIEKLNNVEKLMFPLVDSKGRYFKPIVQEKQKVTEGQIIAQRNDIKILATMDGVITFKDDKIVIIPSDNEFKFQTKDYYKIDLSKFTKDELIEKIKTANIEGLGGALFPAYKKISLKFIRHIILNGVECEPVANADEALMTSNIKEVLMGGLILQKITNAEDITIAIKVNKRELIKNIQEIKNTHPEFKNINIAKVPNLYPAGAAKQVIKFIFGVNLHHNDHATEEGFLVQNVMTSWSIYRAINSNNPQLTRIISIFGDKITNPANILIPIGATLKDIFKQLEITNINSIRTGGIMMGDFIQDISNLEIPVLKSSNSIILNLEQPTANENCINCGKCIQSCPLGLMPKNMLFSIKNKEITDPELDNLEVCMNCNLCNYVCPSQINLTKEFQKAKKIRIEITEQNNENDRLFKLIEQKKERVEKNKKELEDKRKARLAQRKGKTNV